MEFKKRRAARGQSDSVGLTCSCDNNGIVLLFYRYHPIQCTHSAATMLTNNTHGLSGKIRIGVEGFNVTLAGSSKDIEAFMDFFSASSLMVGVAMDDKERFAFFKPSPGCIHVFDGMSIKIVQEICPLNLRTPIKIGMESSASIQSVSPAIFHAMLLSRDVNDTILLDTRNYYESKLGFFKSAILPPIRKFSSLPEYLEAQQIKPKKHVLTYCTGGVRCAKISSYLRSHLDTSITMLEGGIHNYLEWIKESGEESLFLGRNYVFDARVSLGLDDSEVVAECTFCNVKEDRGFYKCIGVGCHLMVICCVECYDLREKGVHCCTSCQDGTVKKGFCECEVARRQGLTGNKQILI